MPHAVGKKLPNAFGLYDISGNVWEWCSDWFASYASEPGTDPTGPSSGTYRVQRGGAWNWSGTNCRSACRRYYDPTLQNGMDGLRLVLLGKVYALSCPSESQWYFANEFTASWPDWYPDAQGFLYALDAEAGTTLGLSDAYTTERSLTLPISGHGTWYFHIVPVDSEGAMVSSAQVDWTVNAYLNPLVISSTTHPDPEQSYAGANASFSWTGPDTDYYCVFDQLPDTVPTTANTLDTSRTLNQFGLTTGTYFLHVRGLDEAGAWSEPAHFQINVAHETNLAVDTNVDTLFDAADSVAVTVSNAGAGTLSWIAEGASPKLSVDPNSATGDSIVVSITAPDYFVGTQEVIFRNDADPYDFETVSIQCTPPQLACDVQAAYLPAQGDSAVLEVSNAGGYQLAWSAEYDDSLVSLSAASGIDSGQITVTASAFANAADTVLTLQNGDNPADTLAVAVHLGQDMTMLPGDVPLEMVWIRPGTFMMGRYSGEQDSETDEDPQHEVTLTQGFWMGKYEVTQAQWEAVMGTTPWSGQDYVLDDPDSPAVYVSWDDAQSFISSLNTLTGKTFRLPTEAEWEYACRAETATRFYWGDDPSYSTIGSYAWFYDNAYSAGQQYAHVVGQKLANDWGLYDMSGNVWEWCADWYGTYPSGSVTDPEGPASGSIRVKRGGGWHDYGYYCRSANRGRSYPSGADGNIGFRLAR